MYLHAAVRRKKTSWESSLCERAKFPVSKRILIQHDKLRIKFKNNLLLNLYNILILICFNIG